MNINDFVASNLAYKFLNEKNGARAAEPVSAGVQSGLEKASQRIQSQVDASTKQLSSVGHLKSAVSSVQLAAIAVARLTTTTNITDVRASVNNFVATFNNAVNTAQAAANVLGDRSVTQSAEKLSKGMLRAVNSDFATLDAMKQVGLSLGVDGYLALDAKKFNAAQNSNPEGLKVALSRISQNVEKFAANELSTGGNISGSLRSLNQRSAMLQNQQTLLTTSGQTSQPVQSRVSSAYLRFAPFTNIDS